MTYEQTLDYLFSQLPMFQKLGRKAYKPSLHNSIELAKFFDNPHHNFKSIHIAGTNGKGTTAHTLASVLQEAGYKVGLYTSPHLKDYRERIRINGMDIDKQFVIEFVESIKNTINTLKPSFFEITVIMAFQYFSQQKVEVAIIETGLGGRYDSTNIIDPELSVITSIGIDHAAILGDTVEKIAAEKAGIIKQGKPVVIPDFIKDSVKKVFIDKALTTASRVNDHSEKYLVTKSDGKINVQKEGLEVINRLIPEIKGNYLIKILPVILESVNELKTIGFEISDLNLLDGISHVVRNTGLKGRWQKLRDNPLEIADVGHNPDGWEEILKQINETPHERIHFVLGMVNDKDVNEIFNLLPSDAIYYLCEPKIPRALPVIELAGYAKRFGFTYTVEKDVNNCLSRARKVAGKEDLIFIGGSTFVVAEIDEL